MKKAELARKICQHVGVQRDRPNLPFLSWREMLYVISWLNLTGDLKAEVEVRFLDLIADKKKKGRKKNA